MIHVIALITTSPGKREEVLAAFKQVVPKVHAEQGCLEYQPVIDAADAGALQTKMGDDAFMVVEKWETMAHLQAHSQADHMKAYAASVGELISERTIHVLEGA